MIGPESTKEIIENFLKFASEEDFLRLNREQI